MPLCPSCSAELQSVDERCPVCLADLNERPRSDPLVGATLPGGYRVLERIGVGGMGNVYRAEQTTLGRSVAVKIVHPHLLSDPTITTRFMTEARTASQLNHPNSIAIIDFGRTPDGQLYLVMEHLRGRDLARVVAEDGLPSLARVCDIICQLLGALAEAHRLGIVHRDLKPENIVIESTRSGADMVKVVDFGLAKAFDAPFSAGVTAAGTVCGTPDYMSPEQCSAQPLDPRSDLYAVGVNLFVLLTGRLPFEAKTPTQVMLMHLVEPPPDPRQVAPSRGISDALAAVTLRALAKEPSARFQTAEELAQALTSVKLELERVVERTSVLPQGTTCSACGATVPPNNKFCGDCGARLSSGDGRPSSPGPARTSHLQFPLPWTGRRAEIAWLQACLEHTKRVPGAACISGDPGSGKSRLLDEFARLAAAPDTVVIRLGPDPWRAGVAYYAVRAAIGALTGLCKAPEQPPRDAGEQERLGLALIFGSEPQEPGPARAAVAAALRWAVRDARGARPVLLIDDLDRVDGASRNAFADLLASPANVPLLVLAAHVEGFVTGWPSSVPVHMLEGLSLDEARGLVEGSPAQAWLPAQGKIAPLHTEQLARFALEGGSQPPPRLGDLIAQRMACLQGPLRRVLQAAAVLGDQAREEQVARLAGEEVDLAGSLASLKVAGWLDARPSAIATAHPMIRETIMGTMPTGVARNLQRAVVEQLGQGLPAEAWALHLLGAEEPFEALLLLDKVGTLALRRGDAWGAVEAFSRGLAFARHQLARGELDDPMHAVLLFSRKLAEALLAADSTPQAESVLREALSVASSQDSERPRLLLALSHASRARDHGEQAARYRALALEAAKSCGDDELMESIQQSSCSPTD